MTEHQCVATASNEAETLFECPVEGCGYRRVINFAERRSTVVIEGAPGVLHGGSNGPIRLTVNGDE